MERFWVGMILLIAMAITVTLFRLAGYDHDDCRFSLLTFVDGVVWGTLPTFIIIGADNELGIEIVVHVGVVTGILGLITSVVYGLVVLYVMECVSLPVRLLIVGGFTYSCVMLSYAVYHIRCNNTDDDADYGYISYPHA